MSGDNIGIQGMGPVSGGTIIGMLQGDLIIDGGHQLNPLEVLRNHSSNATPETRKQFDLLERELQKQTPDKPKISESLKALGGVLGGVAACATAIYKIAHAAGVA